MEKEYILGEIKRTARQNDGIPLGFRTFESETGIKRTDWLGKFWTRWNEAVQEAGFTPNRLKPATPSHELLEKYALFVQGLCRIPAISDHRFKEHRDPELPEHSTFSRILGPKAKLVEQLLEYCRSKDGFLDVVKICEDFTLLKPKTLDEESSLDTQVGFVYLLKHGSRREYKIGRTNNPLRREGEIGIELPEKIRPIHVIKTDDPPGVEAYWHRRFANKRKEGEWFALTNQDVRAFKKWKRIH